MDTRQWVDFGPDGSELVRSGSVWALAPRHRGGDSAWVQVEEGPLVRIACVARAHHVGIRDTASGKWLNAGGRLVVKGEWYREVDTDSRMARDTEALAVAARAKWRRARRPALSPFEEHHWITQCNRRAEESK